MQQLLSVQAGLQQLRHLHVSLPLGKANVEPAMQWTALASTQLTYLRLIGVEWQPGDCEASELQDVTDVYGC
jgi:hypothetical protein